MGKPLSEQSESLAYFSSFYRWINLNFGYVMSMVLLHIRNGGDEMKPFQQSVHARSTMVRQSQVKFDLTPI
jgi:hypothetical protein